MANAIITEETEYDKNEGGKKKNQRKVKDLNH